MYKYVKSHYKVYMLPKLKISQNTIPIDQISDLTENFISFSDSIAVCDNLLNKTTY